MTLKEYLEKHDICAVNFAIKAGISIASIYRYMRGTSRPNRLAAARIEEITGGLVKIKELRENEASRKNHTRNDSNL